MHFNCKTMYYMENLRESHRRPDYLSRVIKKKHYGAGEMVQHLEALATLAKDRQKSWVSLVPEDPRPTSDLLRWSLYMPHTHIQANPHTCKS